MNKLITACLDSKNIMPLSSLNPALLYEQEAEYVQFITEYKRKHKETPSVARFKRAFPFFVEIVNDTHEPITDLFDLFVEERKVDFIQRVLAEVSEKTRDGELTSLQAFEHISNFMTGMDMQGEVYSKITEFDAASFFRLGVGMGTGLSVIDRATKGVFPGEVFLIAARLGIGKSTFMFFLIASLLLAGKKVLCISKEMPTADVFARVDAIIGGFNPLRLRDADEKDREILMGEIGNVTSRIIGAGGELIIPRGSVWSPSHIVTLAKNFAVDAVFVDGVYLLNPSFSSKREQGWESMARVSREIKQAALSLEIPFFTTTQLKRTGTKDEYDSEDLAYSDAIGQDADFILTLRKLPSEDEKALPRIEASLIKDRFGPTASTIFEINYSVMTMRELLV